MKTLYEKTLTGREVEVLLELENMLHLQVGDKIVKLPKKDLVLKVYEGDSYRILTYPEFEGSYVRR